MNNFLEKTTLSDFINQLNQEQFMDLLKGLAYSKSELFLQLYQNAPQHLLPNLKEQNYFTDILKSVINKLDNDRFNHWFFDENLNSYYDVYEVRKLVIGKPDNEKLSAHLKKIDTPSKIEDIIISLFHYKKTNQSVYNEFVKMYKPILKEINTRKFKEKSKITETLFYILNKLSNIEEQKKSCEEIGINLFMLLSNCSNRLNNKIGDYSLQEIQSIWHEINIPDSPKKFNIFDRVFKIETGNYGYLHHIGNILSNKNDPERIEKATFVFDCVLNSFYSENKKNVFEAFKILAQKNFDEYSLEYNKSIALIQLGNSLGRNEMNNYFTQLINKYRTEFLEGILNPLYYKLQMTIDSNNKESPKIKI